MRTALLADKLMERGHSVTWWTSAFDHIKKEWIFTSDHEEVKENGLKFIFLKGTGYKKNISLKRFLDHRMVAGKFYRKALTMEKPDIIVASLPPHDLAFQAVQYAQKNNVPVLVDVRDPWPDIFLEQLPFFLKKAARILLFKDFYMIRETMRNARGVISVTGNFMSWALNYAQRNIGKCDRVFSIGYKKPVKEDLSLVNEKFIESGKLLKDKFVVFFVGTFSRSYHNPMILLEVAEKLKKNKNIHFVIAGDGELFQEIKLASENKANVTLTGWLNRQEIEFWLKNSKAGVCPSSKPVNLPTNKAYAYLSAGLPVITAFEGELKDLVQKYKAGFYYSPGNAKELAGCIIKLYEDKPLYKMMSENAGKVYGEFFNADKIYEEYAKHIEKIAGN